MSWRDYFRREGGYGRKAGGGGEGGAGEGENLKKQNKDLSF